MSYRRTLRLAARSALAAAPALAGFTSMSAWAQNIDAHLLPVFGVATPRETAGRDSHDTSRREVSVMVVLKRLGDDGLEDTLDDDADVVEPLINAALRSAERDCEMRDLSITVSGDGARRVGTLQMTFTVTLWTDDPA